MAVAGGAVPHHKSTRDSVSKPIGGASVTDKAVLAMALHFARAGDEPAGVAAKLVITTGQEEGPAPLPRDRHASAARARRTDVQAAVAGELAWLRRALPKGSEHTLPSHRSRFADSTTRPARTLAR